MEKENNSEKTRLIPLTKWPQYHSWPPIGGLRHLVFYKRQTGFDKVIKKVGSRVLIDENQFFRWVDQQNDNQNK